MLGVAKVVSGRWLRAPLFLAAALTADLVIATQDRAPAAPASIHAPWVDSCAQRMEREKLKLADVSTELGRADVRQAWSVRSAWAELKLLPQYSARIEYRPGDDAPSVFDWEEAPTPVVGSFALHRRVGHFDLTVVADDSDERGLAFAARMQPLLDECVIEAQE